MKGLVYLIFLYLLVFLSSFAVKFYITQNKQKKQGQNTPAPEIYYIKNAVKRRKKPIKPTDITIKGTIINGDND